MVGTILVTGGTGFIGSFIVRKLVEEGRKVVALDIRPVIEENVALWDIKDKFIVVKGSILDWHVLVDTVKKYDVEYIIHTASPLTIEAERNPYTALRVICEGTMNMFELGRVFDIKRIVWSSSIAVYGEPEEYPPKPLTEDDPPKPKTVYGIAKLYCEHMTEWYYKKYGLDIIALRYSVVCGPGRTRGATAYASRIVEDAAYGKKVLVDIDPETTFDWTYVKDVAEANIKALFAKDVKHRIFNVTGKVIKLIDLINQVKKILPEAQIEISKEPRRPPYTTKYGYNNERANKELGWKPKWSLEKGIMDHVNMIHKFIKAKGS